MFRRSTTSFPRAIVAAVAVALLSLTGVSPATATMRGTASISGTVTTLGGEPLEQGMQVYAYSPGGVPLASVTAFVDPRDGSYTLDELPVGDYIVRFVPIPSLEVPYLEQYWNGVYRESEATPVSISDDGQAVAGVDAVMAVGASVSTTLTIAGTDDLASGVRTTLYRVNSDGGLQHVSTQTSGADFPLEDGNLAPGEYTIFADASTRTESPALRSQWLGGSSAFDGAGTFTVGLEETVDIRIPLKPVDPLAALPCVDPRDRAAVRGVLAQFAESGGTLRALGRADITKYLARCR